MRLSCSLVVLATSSRETSGVYFELDDDGGDLCEDVDHSLVAIDLLLVADGSTVALNESLVAHSVDLIECSAVELSLDFGFVVIFHCIVIEEIEQQVEQTLLPSDFSFYSSIDRLFPLANPTCRGGGGVCCLPSLTARLIYRSSHVACILPNKSIQLVEADY